MIDLGWFGIVNLGAAFWAGLGSIIFINLILSGDNAVVIALAVKKLEGKQRTWGIVIGSGLAVVLRIVLTFFAALLLNLPYLKLIGGILIAWIAAKLLIEGAPEEDKIKQAGDLKQAIKIIVIADLIMSTDNVLAVAGAAAGNLFLLILGLATSIPLVIVGAAFLAMLMDKYPIIVYIGSAVLGKVAGELIITDPVIVGLVHPSETFVYIVEAVFAIGVVVAGKLWLKWKSSKDPAEEACIKSSEGA